MRYFSFHSLECYLIWIESTSNFTIDHSRLFKSTLVILATKSLLFEFILNVEWLQFALEEVKLGLEKLFALWFS